MSLIISLIYSLKMDKQENKLSTWMNHAQNAYCLRKIKN